MYLNYILIIYVINMCILFIIIAESKYNDKSEILTYKMKIFIDRAIDKTIKT